MEFGSESSGFLVNADSVTAVVMNDGDSFTTNNTTATSIKISGASMPTLNNLADSVTFSRSGSGIADAEIAIQGFSSGSVIDGNSGNVEITTYGTREDSDEALSLAFNASTGVISRIDGTTDGDAIKVTNATASIAFENSPIQTGSGSFIYKDTANYTALELLGKDDTVLSVGAVDRIYTADGSSAITLIDAKYEFGATSSYFSVEDTVNAAGSAITQFGFNFLAEGDYIKGSLSSLTLTYGENSEVLDSYPTASGDYKIALNTLDTSETDNASRFEISDFEPNTSFTIRFTGASDTITFGSASGALIFDVNGESNKYFFGQWRSIFEERIRR